MDQETHDLFQNELQRISDEYMMYSKAAVEKRWEVWVTGLENQSAHEAIGGLLARQASLANSLIIVPNAWTMAIGPLVLRTMIEAHVTIAWIFSDFEINSARYRDYGLGQLKLLIEKRKEALVREGKSVENDETIKAMEHFLSWQKSSDFTIVNVGSWSGISFRDMGHEVGLPNMVDISYATHSAAVHSTWNYVSQWNMRLCQNPLHRFHFLPDVGYFLISPKFVIDAAMYFEKSLNLFDEKTGVICNADSPYEFLKQEFTNLKIKLEGLF